MDERLSLLKLEIDTPVANAAAKVAQACAGGVSSSQKKSVAVLLDSIRGSKMFPRYVEMLNQQNVGEISLLSRV